MTQRVSRSAPTGQDRDLWWTEVGRALDIAPPELTAAGLPFQQDGITCQFVTDRRHDQALLLITLPARPDVDEADLHRGLLHFQLRHWADSSLLFGLDAQDGTLCCGTRIALDPLPRPDTLAQMVRTRVQQARTWAEQMAFAGEVQEATA